MLNIFDVMSCLIFLATLIIAGQWPRISPPLERILQNLNPHVRWGILPLALILVEVLSPGLNALWAAFYYAHWQWSFGAYPVVLNFFFATEFFFIAAATLIVPSHKKLTLFLSGFLIWIQVSIIPIMAQSPIKSIFYGLLLGSLSAIVAVLLVYRSLRR